MNQSKFSLADVLTVLAALAFGFVCFLGANFLNINNDIVWGMPRITGCVLMAVVCAGLLYVAAFGAKLLKRSNSNFKASLVAEIVLLIFFISFAIFFTMKSSPFPHYFTVTSQKTEIQSNLQTSITQAEKMFTAYESYANDRINLYEEKLKAVVDAESINPTAYTEYGFVKNTVSNENQIETKMFTLHADLFPTNYSGTITRNGIKEVATDWLQDAKTITNSWKPIGIVGVVNDIEKNSTEWLSILKTLSQVRAQGEEAEDFNYTLSFRDVKSQFTQIGRPDPISIGLAVLVYVLMLLSWFVTKRDGKPYFDTKPYEVVL